MCVLRRFAEMAAAASVAATALAGPDGGEWQDPSRLSLGKEPASTVRAPADAIDLSGVEAWRFNWCRRPSERPVGFERPDYDVSGWPLVTVPCSWQACGIRKSGERFGVPIYVNTTYTFTPAMPANRDCPPRVVGNDVPKDWTLSGDDNPVGSYRRDFDVPAEWLADEVFIRFEGVESFYYLWINGKYVGFSKDSRSPSVYNITKYVKPGRNVVAAEVYRYSDGSYLECQDVFRLSGILRPVRVYRLRKGHLKDVRFETHPAEKGVYDGDWVVTFAADREASFRLYEKGGGEVECKPLGGGRFLVRRPRTWSAETPNLYSLVTEGLSFNLGFREVEITEPADPRDRTFLVNGRPVKLKGVNRTEVDPTYGHHCPTWRLRQDIELIKRGNLNHIRNSHCPQPDEFYDLCDEYGIYVMDEANLESHGMGYGRDSISWRPEWFKAHLERQVAMVCRNRNHPCVVMWSMGNEAGPGEAFRLCYEWIKKTDPTRPVNYERNSDFADVGSRQYPDLYWIKATAAGRENVKYPFHINEFLHNLNNNAGGVKHFQDAIESSNRILGSALWDYADQGLYAVDKATGRTFLAFGGDFGERPTDGQGILDGIVHADRRVEPAYYETRHAYQPFDTRLDAGGESVTVESKYFFRDSSAYEMRVNGRRVDIAPVAPRERRRIPLAALGPRKGEARLLVEFVQREAEGVFPAGWVIASDQIAVPGVDEREAFAPAGEAPAVDDGPDTLALSAGGMRYAFSKKTGSLESIRKDGVELLAGPVFLDAFRAPFGADISLGRDERCNLVKWGRDGLRNLVPRLGRMTKPGKGAGSVRFSTVVEWRGARKERILRSGHCNPAIEDEGEPDCDAPGYHAATEWRVFGDGSLAVSAAFRQFGRATWVPRIGYRFVLKGGDSRISYKAAGPWDSYPDRRSGAFVGEHSGPLASFVEPYGRTSDSGNRMEAHWLRVEPAGITFAGAGAPVPAVQVSPYSPTEIILNPHVELLPEPVKTEVGLYAVQSGMGSSNCGPATETEYRIDPLAVHSFAFVLSTRDLRSVQALPPAEPPAPAAAPCPPPKDLMLFPGDEAAVLGGRAVMSLFGMRFCTETELWKFSGSLPDVKPISWMVVKPAGGKGRRFPVVAFLKPRGNHEFIASLCARPSAGAVDDDLASFAVGGAASELSRGRFADPSSPDYFPLDEIVSRGFAVVTACPHDVRRGVREAPAYSPEWILDRVPAVVENDPELDAGAVRTLPVGATCSSRPPTTSEWRRLIFEGR